jgi:PAS domain S-box-containing protein
VGRYVFDVFPDNPLAPQANGVRNLKASLQQVLQTKAPHQMALQHYDVPDPKAPGQFVERYWSPLNTPILDEKGEVICIVHQVVNVTEKVKTEQQLLKSQAKEQQALAEAGRLREHLYTLFQEAPAPIVILEGEQLVYELVNPAYRQIFPGRELLGKPLLEALPELRETPIPGILEKVYQTGEMYVAREMPLMLARREGGPLDEMYWTFICQARRNEKAQVDGVLVFAYEVTEQVSARKKLELDLDTMPQIVWTADAGGDLIYLNQHWYDYTGDNRTEFSHQGKAGEQLAACLHPEDSERQLDHWQAYIASGHVFELEVRVKRALDGAYRWHLNRGVPIRNQAGAITRWVGTATDIHDHKVMEAALAESLHRLTSMFEQTVVGIALADLDLKLTYANEQYCRILGRSRTEVLALNMRDITHPDDLDTNLRQLREAKESGTPFGIQKRYFKPDGSIVWVVNNVSLIRDQAGTPLYYMAVCQDITARRQAEEALQESEERFRTMAEASPVLIAHTDQDGNAVYFNKEWIRLTGRTMEELVNYGWADLLHPEDREGFVDAYLAAFRRRELLKREFRLRSQQGEYRWQLAVVSPRFGPNGAYAGHISSCIDIADLKAAEQALALKNAQLTAINNDLDNFVYTASHDLKAPIYNIEGLMKVLIRSIPPESMQTERVEYTTRMILESVERFKRTIGDLTEISKLQKEANQPVTPVSVKQVIEEVILDLKPAIEASGARIQMDVAEFPTIDFSEKNLRSIIYNLLSNAIKYRSPDRSPQVRIYGEQTGQYRVLSVEDNGLGLDLTKDRQEKLFAMFKRLHNHVEGTGVGLYMVKKIVENAGGKIEVKSKVGIGSTFSVFFKR